MGNLSLQRPIAFFDLETTGTDVAKDRIVEISILKINPDQSEEVITRRVNPEMPIPPVVSEIHGIYDADVADKPTWREMAPEMYEILEPCDLGGYNCNRFDVPLLIEEFLRVDITFDIDQRKVVDVQRIFHKMEQRTLSAALQFYCNEELNNAHSAEADTRATYDVLKAQLDRYDVLSNDAGSLHEFTNDGGHFIDTARRFVRIDGVACFNFGKHKGKSVAEVLTAEPGYYDWMMRSDFARHTKLKLKQIKLQMHLNQ